jgi:hypothetical protein
VKNHRKVAQSLRAAVKATMQTLLQYFLVLEDNAVPMAQLQSRVDDATVEVATRLRGWAGDAEMRSMAVHLQRGLYVCMPNEVRLYEHTIPTLADAISSMQQVGYQNACLGHGPCGHYYKKSSMTSLAQVLQNGGDPLAIYFNAINHFEYLTLRL